MAISEYDVGIIGGGIVGLATAYAISLRAEGIRIAVFEKEKDIALHQTGRNSGVIHSGIYYKPGSLKATNCRKGREALQVFCREQEIPFEICGKLILATDETELPALERLVERGKENGVSCELVEARAIRELEPHASGVRGIYVRDAGIVDFKKVCRRLSELLAEKGHDVSCGTEVLSGQVKGDSFHLGTNRGDFVCRRVVNCAGLHSDRVAKKFGVLPRMKIIPFRGQYYKLRPEAYHLCRNLIYPVPDVRFPFLGVHFTRMIKGGVDCGPNASLALAREGYEKFDFSPRDLFESLTYPGFIRLAPKYWREGGREFVRTLSKRAFVAAARRLVPEARIEYFVEAPAGIRAQAVDSQGKLIDDFVIEEREGIIHVLNAPSPAATASLNIGELISERLLLAS